MQCIHVYITYTLTRIIFVNIENINEYVHIKMKEIVHISFINVCCDFLLCVTLYRFLRN